MKKLLLLILPLLGGCSLFSSAGLGLSVRISEIGCAFYQDPVKTADLPFIELYNYGSEPVELSDMELRCTASRLGAQTLWAGTFRLPVYTLQPGAYMQIRSGAPPAEYDPLIYTDPASADYIENYQIIPEAEIARTDDPAAGIFYLIQEDYFPYWTNLGFAELISRGQSVSFVRWGSSSIAYPVNGTYENAAPATTFSELYSAGRSIGRIDENTNTDSGRDWIAYTKATPGLPNDTEMP